MALENAYNGNILRSYDMNSFIANLELAKKTGNTRAMSDEINYVIETADVKPFPIPIVIGDDVFVDARTFTALDNTGALKIRNPIEHQIRLDEARWELVWKRNNGKHEALMAKMPSHHEIFCKWVSEAITHTYALAPYQSGQIKAICALFSIGQFYNSCEDDVKALRLQKLVADQLDITFELFESVTGHTDYLFPRNIEEFVETILAADISPRLKDISVLSINQLLGNSFYGISYDMYLSRSAIEYPPSLFVMIKACLDNNMFNRSRLGAVVKKSNMARKADRFEYTYNMILNQNTKPINAK